MKKRIHYLVALVLALTMVFAMAMTVSATETETTQTHEHCVCGGSLEGHSHEVIQWQAWTETTKLPSASGNYYLTANVDLSSCWYVTNKSINLCLNGYTINGAGTKGEGDDNNPNTIMMGNTTDNVAETAVSKLVITDCQGTGLIQSDTNMNGGALRFRNDPYATVEIYGGELKSTVTEGTKEGGAVYMLGGNLYLYGGSITGGDSVYQSGTGANTNGGAVYLNNAAKFNMYGGTINGGTDYSRGAGVAVRHADAAFNMYGGTIQGGSSNYGDGIHCYDGSAYVYGGTIDVFSGNNIHITGNGSLTIQGAYFPKGLDLAYSSKPISQALAEGSAVWLDGVKNAATATKLAGAVIIAEDHIDHCYCNGALAHSCQDASWTPWTDSTKLPSANGNYFLATDVQLDAIWYVTNKSINLCLNGHTINGQGAQGEGDSNNLNTIMMGNTPANAAADKISKLVITDCVGSGVIQSDSNIPGGALRFRNDPYATVEIYGGELKSTVVDGTKQGGAVFMDGGNLYLYGGAITGGDALYQDGTTGDKNGGAVCLNNAAQFYMHGGVVNGGTDYNRGASVAVRHANAAFYMYGGTIQGGSSNFGDAIHCNLGTVYIDGGIIDIKDNGNNIHITSNGSFTIKSGTFLKGINMAYTLNNVQQKLADVLEPGSYILMGDSYHAGDVVSLTGEVNIVSGSHTHCVCADNYADHDCSGVAWIEWTETSKLPSASGNYYLGTDVVLEKAWDFGNKTINLCLNGYTITGAGGTAQTIMLGSGSDVADEYITNLTITDCNDNAGSIVNSSDQNGAVIRTRKYGNITVNLYNGTVDAICEAATNEGGAVALNSGVFNMYGGTLDGYATSVDANENPKNGGTVALYNAGTEFNMYGGLITGGSVSAQEGYGGNVLVSAGAFNMHGGEITGGEAVYGAGNVYIKANGSFTMYDGTISGGVVSGASRMGGNLWLSSGTADLIGGTISGGTATHGGNLRLTGGTMTLSGTTVTGGVAEANGGNVSVTGGTLNMTDGSIELGQAASGGNIFANGGTYNLTGGVIADGNAINNGGNIYFDRNGSLGTVTISGGTAVSFGGSIYVDADAVVDINGATITNSAQSATAHKGGVIFSKGTLTITNAEISGGYADTSPSGGTIAVAAGETSITGSTLTAGWGSRGTCVDVYDSGVLTIKDSTVHGRETAGPGTTSVGTCFWIEGNGVLKLVGDVVITGPGLDIVHDIRNNGTAYTDITELNITGEEKISVKNQTNEGGQVIYAGANADAINMVEAYLDSYQTLFYNAETGYIEVVMSALVGYDALGNPYGFANWADAMAESLTRIVVYHPVSGTISKNIVLDLNGIDLTDMVIESGVTVQLIDTETDGFADGAYGTLSGTINGTVETFVTYGGKTYLAVAENGVYSAHCYDVKLTHVSLDPTNDALGYKAELFGDEIVRKYVTGFGFELWLDGTNAKVYSVANADKQVLTLRLQNILANNGGEMNINAVAFVTLTVNGQSNTKKSEQETTTMKDTILAVNAMTKLTDAQKAAVYGLYEKYSTVMDGWLGETNNIKTWAPAVEETETV